MIFLSIFSIFCERIFVQINLYFSIQTDSKYRCTIENHPSLLYRRFQDGDHLAADTRRLVRGASSRARACVVYCRRRLSPGGPHKVMIIIGAAIVFFFLSSFSYRTKIIIRVSGSSRLVSARIR